MKRAKHGGGGGDSLCIVCCSAFKASKLKSAEREAERNAEVEGILCQFAEHILFEQCGRSKVKVEEPRCGTDKEPEVEETGDKQPQLQPVKRRKGRGKRRVTLEKLMEMEERDAAEGKQTPLSFRTRIVEMLDSCREDDMSICGGCLETMRRTTDARQQSLILEENVRQLQLTLLTQLRLLQKQMASFYSELEEMRVLVEDGQETALAARLNFQGSKKYKRMKSWPGKTPVNRYTLRRERALSFRRQIAQVSRDAQRFRENLTQKFGVEGDGREEDPVFDETVSEEMDTQCEVKIEPEPVEHLDDFSADFEEETDTVKLLVLEADPIENEGGGDEDVTEEEEPQGRAAAAAARRRVKSFVNVMERREEDDASASGEEEEQSEDDCDFEVTITKAKVSLRDLEPVFRGMGTFKRAIVERVVRKQQWNKQNRRKKLNRERNIYQEHLMQLEYDAKRKCISLGGALIHILEAEQNPKGGNGLQCGQCEFQLLEASFPDKDKLSVTTYEHVISQHFQAYKCPQCEHLLDTHSNYYKHVDKCVRMECPVCGKPLSKWALRGHLWLHKNAEERAEAIAQGFKPQEYDKDKERTFPCATCGNLFPSRHALSVHEECHLSREDRERMICPRCGKDLLKSGWPYHQRYSECAQGAQEVAQELPVVCTQCGKIFPNKFKLKLHRKSVHSESSQLRPFVCAQCGKAFKVKHSLQRHELKHSGVKYKCTACGKQFAEQRSVPRHKKTCPLAKEREGNGLN